MKPNTQAILTDAEIMEMLGAFYSEALRFLRVPQDQWAKISVGIVFDGAEEKVSIISINYEKRKILVNLFVLKMIIQSNPKAVGDTPSVYRSYGYKLARFWQQYLKTGECHIFEEDKDSDDFAMALGIVKGLPQIDLPINESMVEAVRHNPFDREAAIRMLRDEFGMDCCVKQGFDIFNKETRMFVTLTDGERQRRGTELLKLFEDSNNRSLPKINEGELGSKSNPFANVDKAAEYILAIEKERLGTDVYRQAIKDEQYFFDDRHGCFRISWASANVGYYPLKGVDYPCFVVNQLSQRDGHAAEMPRFSIKPSLAQNKSGQNSAQMFIFTVPKEHFSISIF